MSFILTQPLQGAEQLYILVLELVRDGTHDVKNADHRVVGLEGNGNERFHCGLLDDRQEGRIRVLIDVVADEQGRAARDHASAKPFSLADTGSVYFCASLSGLRPDNEFISLIVAQGQHAGVGFEKSARTLDDQI